MFYLNLFTQTCADSRGWTLGELVVGFSCWIERKDAERIHRQRRKGISTEDPNGERPPRSIWATNSPILTAEPENDKLESASIDGGIIVEFVRQIVLCDRSRLAALQSDAQADSLVGSALHRMCRGRHLRSRTFGFGCRTGGTMRDVSNWNKGPRIYNQDHSGTGSPCPNSIESRPILTTKLVPREALCQPPMGRTIQLEYQTVICDPVPMRSLTI